MSGDDRRLRTLELWSTVKEHQGGYRVLVNHPNNRVEVAVGGGRVILDQMYRWCPRCDAAQPLSDFTWRTVDCEHFRTQPYCARHPRNKRAKE